MNVAHIRERMEGNFKPFAVVTSSGHKYPVPHPDFIFVVQRSVVIADQRGYVVNLDPLHIVGLEALQPARNGNSRRTRKK
ncbi:MAG: hypothetical protein ABSH38_02575 [Verrucomicrobiota bacterium]